MCKWYAHVCSTLFINLQLYNTYHSYQLFIFKNLYFLHLLDLYMINSIKKNRFYTSYAKLTHDFNFTYFYPSIVHAIKWTAWCISRWSCVDKCNPSCYVVDGYFHNRRRTSRLGIMMVDEMFGITQRIKCLRNIRVNRKSCWSCICLKINC